MPWHPFTTTNARFIAITGFRMQAQITRAKVPATDRARYDAGTNRVVASMQAAAAGSTGLVFDPSPAEVRDHVERGLSRTTSGSGAIAAALPTADSLMNNPAAVAAAQENLVKLAFLSAAGAFQQEYP